MKTKQIEQGLISVGERAGSTALGVVTATAAKKMLAGKLPVPSFVTNLALGAGVVAVSTTQKGKVKAVLEHIAAGHVIVSLFDAANNFKVPGAPMINGMRGMRGMAGRGMGTGYYGTSRSLITAGEPSPVGGLADDDMFVNLSGPEEEVAKKTFEYM